MKQCTGHTRYVIEHHHFQLRRQHRLLPDVQVAEGRPEDASAHGSPRRLQKHSGRSGEETRPDRHAPDPGDTRPHRQGGWSAKAEEIGRQS